MKSINSFFKLVFKEKKYSKSILNLEIIKSIINNLESKYKVSDIWHLVYSTYEHGFSLQTLIVNIEKFEPPFIFICETTNGNKFGVFIDDKITFSKNLKGKRNTFLYKYEKDETRIFNYSGKCPYFCLCSKSFMGFGCSDGKFGLVLDSTLLTGTSNTVSTFENEILTDEEKFKIKKVEVWGIGF